MPPSARAPAVPRAATRTASDGGVEAQPPDGTAAPILAFATQGSAHLDALRLRELLAPLGARELDFDRAHKLRAARALWRAAGRERPALIVMEGTGIAGGVTVLALRALRGIPYVVSSGDAVGPYLALGSRLAGLAGGVYERLLCRRCAGYIGWSPYLAGRALTFGAAACDDRPRVGPGARRRPAPGSGFASAWGSPRTHSWRASSAR